MTSIFRSQRPKHPEANPWLLDDPSLGAPLPGPPSDAMSLALPGVEGEVRRSVARGGSAAFEPEIGGLYSAWARHSVTCEAPLPLDPMTRAGDRQLLTFADRALEAAELAKLRLEGLRQKLALAIRTADESPSALPVPLRLAVAVLALLVGAGASHAVANLMAESLDLLFGRPWFADMADFLSTSPEQASMAWSLQLGYTLAGVQALVPFALLAVQAFSKVSWPVKLFVYAFELAFALGFFWLRRSTELAVLAAPAGLLEFAVSGLYAVLCAALGEALTNQHQRAEAKSAVAKGVQAATALVGQQEAEAKRLEAEAIAALEALRVPEAAAERQQRRAALAEATAENAYLEQVYANAAALGGVAPVEYKPGRNMNRGPWGQDPK